MPKKELTNRPTLSMAFALTGEGRGSVIVVM
jgi:hypothetical protein